MGPDLPALPPLYLYTASNEIPEVEQPGNKATFLRLSCTELHLSIRVQLEIMNATVEGNSHLLPLDTNVQWMVFYEECGDYNCQNKPLDHNCYQS